MGLLTKGSALSWEETQRYRDYVKKHGILQFINLYKKLKERENDEFKWGDEIEYMLVHFDNEHKKAQLALVATEVLPKLMQPENEAIKKGEEDLLSALWRPEYGNFMIESAPGTPNTSDLECFSKVEDNMRVRRSEANAVMKEDDFVMTLTNFPRNGCPDFTFPASRCTPLDTKSFLRSLFFPDECVFPDHPRFMTMARNMVQRRGSKPVINVPIFVDKNTPQPFMDDLFGLDTTGNDLAQRAENHVYMDCGGFGAGCCCLQATFQARNTEEGRRLYDQLIPLCPILLAMTAAAPIYKGYLVQTDCRWGIESQSLDDRTEEERGLKPLQESRHVIPKARYGSVDSYLSDAGSLYNDVDLVVDEELLKIMLDAGVDVPLARHVAHLFIRDPVLILKENLHQDDEKDSDHFEGIQSSNWQSMRFKPPPPDSPIGCRVEFRPMEVQLTDFENAAFVIFIVLLTRVILTFDLNLLIPMSKVEENIKEAQKMDAVRNGQFYFRRDIFQENSPTTPPFYTKYFKFLKKEYSQMSINHIINGKKGHFPGLLPLIKDYLKSVELSVETHTKLRTYLRFIRRRASGELKTAARWMRDFVDQHPEYKHDSIVNDRVNYDLLSKCRDLASGQAFDPSLQLERAPPLQAEDSDEEDWSQVDVDQTEN
ncbi:glutamate--cysteine ligase catalytic subunit-like [Paramacrobiotus metropolitanus]|uniref:glutamate--cysteine ligase catalytic subunit-like n=1 Tax=Paramacrobiotus metropolitanus TaxID=2943436 RepID=UPI002446168B|nr:glutamate--cysteine ligase catalytic subunit-like [Paramacrobiotus metropolitanus]